MFRYLSADIICTKKWTDFQERSSKKTVSLEEQMVSKDKYLHQMEAAVFIILQIFFATCTVLKIADITQKFPCVSWEHIQSSNAFRPNLHEGK